jgi:mono/diheme cytochrome c family protein
MTAARHAHVAGLLAIFVVFVGIGMCASGRVRASETPAPVFTAKQATAGQSAYAQRCASCHMPDLSGGNDVPPLSGDLFLSTWRARTTKDLIDYMSAAMPPAGPALTADTYASIGAFILKANGAIAGTQELTPTTAVSIGSVTKTAAP